MTLVYAHRGSSAQFAEHTRAAYLQAIADGADGVECDVHLSADHEVVLLHDDTLDRTSDGTGAVAEHTLAQLRELDFSSWKGVAIPEEFGSPSQQFLTLGELLDILLEAGRPIGLAIEFKHPAPFGYRLEEATLEILLERGWSPQNSTLGNVSVSFMSFDPEATRYLLTTVPGAYLCQLVEAVEAEEISKKLGFGSFIAAGAAAAVRLAMHEGEQMLDDGEAGLAGPGVDYLRSQPDRVRQWREAGRRCRVWTVDDAEDVQLCLDAGIEEITTNKPAEVRALLT